MNSRLLWIGALTLGFAACNENKDEEAEARPIPERRRASGDRSASLKPTRSAPPRAAGEEVSTETGEEPMAGVMKPAPTQEELEARQAARDEQGAEREVRRAERREQRVAEITVRMTSRMSERDADGDGLLAKDEISGRMLRGFDDADANGDGYLDSDEQDAMIQQAAERMSEFDRDRGGRGGRGGGGGGGGRGGRGGGR